MNRQERRRLEREPRTINKQSLEYREGIKEGIRIERGNFVTALDRTKGIGDKLLYRVLDELAKVYRGESK